MSSSEDDDQAFDTFLASLKPVKTKKYRVSLGSLDDFIVDDSHLSFDDSSFWESEGKKCDKKVKIQKNKGTDFHESYIDDTDGTFPIDLTNDAQQIREKLPRSKNYNNGDRTDIHSTGTSRRKISIDDYSAKLHQDNRASVNNDKRKTKSNDTKQSREMSAGKELLQTKIMSSEVKGNWSIMKKFTPKRSTACSNSITSRGAFSTPRIIFSSDSDSDEETSGGMSNEDDGIRDDSIEKASPTVSIPSEDIDKMVENRDSEDAKLGKIKQHYDSSIESLCSDFDQVDLDREKSNKDSVLTSNPGTASALPLTFTKKRSKILIYSDDSESDEDVIYVESDSDKENSERNTANRGLSSFEIDNDNVFLTPTPIRKKAPLKPAYTPLQNTKPERNISNCGLSSVEADSDNIFLTPTLIRKKAPLKPTYTPLQSRPTNAPCFKIPTSTQKNSSMKKDGLPSNLPRNCGNGAGFKRHRDELTRSLYEYFNKTIFEGELPKDMIVEWDKRLLKTAGVTKCSSRTTTTSKNGITCIDKVYSARICLSDKVLDSLHRLRDTLCHEMCHAAVWLIDKQSDGHGPFWKGWARKAMVAHPEMPIVRRCHSYDISYKFHYQCIMCRKIYGRHSKSIKVDKQVCGVCKGRLVFLPPKNLDGTPVKVRPPNKFAMFVKENYKITQKSNSVGGVTPKHSDVMKALSRQFASLSAKK